MAKRVTFREIEANAQERRDRHTFGLRQEEFDHLLDTFKSVTRFTRAGVHNPRFVEKFVEDLPAFAQWSKQNGFGLDRELELIGPYLQEGTRLVVKRESRWIDQRLVFEREYTLYSEDGDDEDRPEILPEHWVTDYRELRWVKRDDLKRRTKKFLLTNYGHGRLKERRKPLTLSCFGETKTASAWSKDARCMVSDKVLKKRREDGWRDCDAIQLPAKSPKPASA